MSKFVFSNDDGVPTRTSEEQRTVERKVNYIYEREGKESLALVREKHVSFLLRAFDGLSQGINKYESLDASKPWLCYWVVHGLDLLDAFPSQYNKRIVEYLSRCQDPKGGFCGGPGQLPHLAPTYAAINALIICGSQDEEAYKVINREKLYSFLLRMKSSDGGFTMHEDGEVDVRGTYCALSVARMLNILTPELIAGAAEYVVKCQTYEGGIGGYPGNEAHGGYTFCGVAAMVLMGKINMLNVPLLLNWVAQRQMDKEGGFQGRTNKLVDSCYSFWQGALFPLIQRYQHSSIEDETQDKPAPSEWMFNEEGLLKYVLTACQDQEGGLKDKPGKGRDYYHTCYALSGLSVSQHAQSPKIDPQLLKPTHPVHNIRPDRVAKVVEFFKSSALS